MVLYIFMPPPLGAGGIMFSRCPSVRPSDGKPEIPSFHQYMSLLVHSTNCDRFAACLSVRRGFQAFARERMEGMAQNFACWCIMFNIQTDCFGNMKSILLQVLFEGLQWSHCYTYFPLICLAVPYYWCSWVTWEKLYCPFISHIYIYIYSSIFDQGWF